jgi:hypothetical protein
LSSTTQFVSIALILLVLATYLILTQTIRRRRRAVPLRPIRAFEMLRTARCTCPSAIPASAATTRS